jgi:hypothetical protein
METLRYGTDDDGAEQSRISEMGEYSDAMP